MGCVRRNEVLFVDGIYLRERYCTYTIYFDRNDLRWNNCAARPSADG